MFIGFFCFRFVDAWSNCRPYRKLFRTNYMSSTRIGRGLQERNVDAEGCTMLFQALATNP